MTQGWIETATVMKVSILIYNSSSSRKFFGIISFSFPLIKITSDHAYSSLGKSWLLAFRDYDIPEWLFKCTVGWNVLSEIYWRALTYKSIFSPLIFCSNLHLFCYPGEWKWLLAIWQCYPCWCRRQQSAILWVINSKQTLKLCFAVIYKYAIIIIQLN